MKTITHTCDRCKQTGNTVELPLYPVRVSDGNAYGRYYAAADWCKACMRAAGLLKPEYGESDATPPPEPVTIEDLVREIVQEELETQ